MSTLCLRIGPAFRIVITDYTDGHDAEHCSACSVTTLRRDDPVKRIRTFRKRPAVPRYHVRQSQIPSAIGVASSSTLGPPISVLIGGVPNRNSASDLVCARLRRLRRALGVERSIPLDMAASYIYVIRMNLEIHRTCTGREQCVPKDREVCVLLSHPLYFDCAPGPNFPRSCR